MKTTISLGLGTALLAISAPVAVHANGAQGNDASAVAATTISDTTSFRTLVIAEGAIQVAPEGKLLTLTVDGVEVPLAPGQYSGNVVLSVTDDISSQIPRIAYPSLPYRVVRRQRTPGSCQVGCRRDLGRHLRRRPCRRPAN